METRGEMCDVEQSGIGAMEELIPEQFSIPSKLEVKWYRNWRTMMWLVVIDLVTIFCCSAKVLIKQISISVDCRPTSEFFFMIVDKKTYLITNWWIVICSWCRSFCGDYNKSRFSSSWMRTVEVKHIRIGL